MDQAWLYLGLASTTIASILFFVFHKSKQSLHQPPSPPSLPIIGHLHLLKQPLHRTLQALSSRYGAIYFLKFARRHVVVISNPAVLEECFAKNDVVLSNRPHTLATELLHCDSTTLGAVRYGELWRNMRRVTTLKVFSTHQVNSFADVRSEEVNSLTKDLFRIVTNGCEDESGFVRVEMRPLLTQFTFRGIMRTVAGKRYFGETEKATGAAEEFHGVVRDVFDLSGEPNPADFLPFLKFFKVDFLNLERRMLPVKKKLDSFLQRLVDECRSRKNKPDDSSSITAEESNSLLFNLLSLQDSDPENCSDLRIKGIIVSLLFGGTDTTSITLEWALALLINHPDILEKARQEIAENVGHERLTKESDLSNLPYLQGIINEVLRLFPASPLFVRETSDDCTIGGYHIQEGTMVIFNSWAIHRDPALWDDPLVFRPERFEFEVAKTDNKMKWVPFGCGRRSCPGALLANRTMALTLAQLIQCFDWKRTGEENVDLAEGFGVTMPKAQPLEVMCRVHRDAINIISEYM